MNPEDAEFDVSSPEFVFSFVLAGMADIAFIIFGLGILIPGVGIVLAAVLGLAHYAAGGIILVILWNKLKKPSLGDAENVVGGVIASGGAAIPALAAITAAANPIIPLLIAIAIPLPTLTIGIIIAAILKTSIVEKAIEEIELVGNKAVDIALATETGGGSLATKEAALAAEQGLAKAGAEAAEKGLETAGKGGLQTAQKAAEKETAGSRWANRAKKAGERRGSQEGLVSENEDESEVAPEDLGLAPSFYDENDEQGTFMREMFETPRAEDNTKKESDEFVRIEKNKVDLRKAS
jgi:hypothetical protein